MGSLISREFSVCCTVLAIARDVLGYNHREIFALLQRALCGAILLIEVL
jgi:hypothetical protein